MVCYNPVFAQQPQFVVSDLPTQISPKSLPVTYLSEEESKILIWDMQRRGYTVVEGTFEQLAELEQNTAKSVVTDKEGLSDDQKELECKKEKDNKESNEEKVENKVGGTDLDITNTTKAKGCDSKNDSETLTQPATLPPGEVVPPSESHPAPPPLPPAPHPPATVHTDVGIYADLSYGGSGGRSDAGKVFFILAGIMAIAVFIVYAGKYISDLAKGKDYKVWREVIFSSTFLDTGSGQHGDLMGVKIAMGFVSSDLIQVALVGEVGKTDLDLILNEYTNPIPVDISATYWMLGATARLHLSDKLVNASYLYLDFMGGSTSDSATDSIGMARFGASFGIDDYMRLGASIGAHYIGLDEDQGFANDGDNYWMTLGVEMGVKF